MFLLFACTQAPSSVKEISPPSGDILYIQESEGALQSWLQPAQSPQGRLIEGIAGAVYPGPIDPLNEALLLISVDESHGHAERAWLVNKTASPTLLGPPANRLRNPSWSPDGQWLYVEADWRSFSDIYRLPRAGGEAARLTAAPHGSFEPAVSPDGTTVAFGSSRDGNAEIYLMGIAGGPATRLSHDLGDDIHPRWQSAKHLAWLRRREGKAAFWLTDLDHPEKTYALAQSPEAEALDLVFSADGHWAAITVRYPPNEQAIEVIDTEKNTIIARLDGEGPDETPCFSPDHQWILFSSARSGDIELWLVHPDGSELQQWTHRTGADWLPRWLPPW